MKVIKKQMNYNKEILQMNTFSLTQGDLSIRPYAAMMPKIGIHHTLFMSEHLFSFNWVKVIAVDSYPVQ